MTRWGLKRRGQMGVLAGAAVLALPGAGVAASQASDVPPPIETRPAPVPVIRDAPPPPRPAPAPGPRKLASKNMRAWMVRIIETWPIAAKREGREGTVSVTVTVSADGRAGDCKVAGSSGHADLDEAACKGILRYARFDPALDDKGRPTPAPFAASITFGAEQAAYQGSDLPPPPPLPVEPPEPWSAARPAAPTPPMRGPRMASPVNVPELVARIIETYPAQAKREGREGVVGITVTVTPEGRVGACTVTQSSGHADLDQAACAGMTRFARFNPALGGDGEPMPAAYSTRITYRAN